jgi:hypothetical protein
MPTEKDFETELAKCKNPDARQFFEGARGQQRTKTSLRYDDANDKLRWYVTPQIHKARVVQKGRFPHDQDFWRSRVSVPASVGPKRKTDGDADLRFDLVTGSDFAIFKEIAETEARVRALHWEISRRK